jgi:hypothetical protein
MTDLGDVNAIVSQLNEALFILNKRQNELQNPKLTIAIQYLEHCIYWIKEVKNDKKP